MRQLSDTDIEQMADGVFIPDVRAVNRAVRAKLRLGTLIPDTPAPTPRHARLDLHQKTVEQAWAAILKLANSGARDATIITGASGILHQTFPQWATDSVLAPMIAEFRPINNGSFFVKFRRNKKSQ